MPPLIFINMGWGINFKTDVYLSKQSYSSIGEVEDAIEKFENDIRNATNMLLMLASTNNLSTNIEIEEDVLYYIKNKVEDEVNTILDAEANIIKLTLYKEHLKEKEN